MTYQPHQAEDATLKTASAQIRALKVGLSLPLANGGKVFGVLSEDLRYTCFDLTSPEGTATRFALSDEAFAAMYAIRTKLLMDATGMSMDAAKSTQTPMDRREPGSGEIDGGVR